MFKKITDAKDMTKAPIPWDDMDENWRKRLIDMNVWWYKEHPVGKSQYEQEAIDKAIVLRNKLLSFGGNIACMQLNDMHYDAIMQRGQYWYGIGVHKKKGYVNQCHYNSCVLWDKNKGKMSIATGYALSKDGCWRQHSWVVEPLKTKYRIWETTTDRIAYFGVVLTPEECEEFYDLCNY